VSVVGPEVILGVCTVRSPVTGPGAIDRTVKPGALFRTGGIRFQRFTCTGRNESAGHEGGQRKGKVGEYVLHWEQVTQGADGASILLLPICLFGNG
jgi:hypothetical protein